MAVSMRSDLPSEHILITPAFSKVFVRCIDSILENVASSKRLSATTHIHSPLTASKFNENSVMM